MIRWSSRLGKGTKKEKFDLIKLGNQYSLDTVAENTESEDFWQALGGKAGAIENEKKLIEETDQVINTKWSFCLILSSRNVFR